ncbi:MAG: prolipoprotein diacylglyceryl transferase [Rhodobacteraceae bacterium]|nr:MAG: prolipoprotein diacylglyceryl transferase [Paracoccaceae bacterium]
MLVLPFPAIDPALFTLDLGFIQFSLRWYALAYIVGLAIGWAVVAGLARRDALWPGGRSPITPKDPEDLLAWIAVGVILGGRLGFVFFYQPGYYLANPAEILMVWQGGMSFHGGFLGAVLALVFWCRSKGVAPVSVGDAVAVATPPGLLLGRLANFVNGELWGRPTDVPWAMIFPGSDGLPRHPSQLYQAALEGAALTVLMVWALRRGWLRRPGALTGLFFAGYGAARAIGENFRQGDAQFVSPANPNGHVWRFGAGPDAFGLTMGQILSLPMIAVGLALIAVAFARRAPA